MRWGQRGGGGGGSLANGAEVGRLTRHIADFFLNQHVAGELCKLAGETFVCICMYVCMCVCV